MPIQYSGTIRYPAGVFAAHEEAIAKVVRESRKGAGCLAYSLARDVADPDLFILYERWADEAAFQAHFASPHATEFRAVMEGMTGVEAHITRFETDDGTPLG